MRRETGGGTTPKRWASIDAALAELEFHKPTWRRVGLWAPARLGVAVAEWATRCGDVRERLLLRDAGGWFFAPVRKGEPW